MAKQRPNFLFDRTDVHIFDAVTQSWYSADVLDEVDGKRQIIPSRFMCASIVEVTDRRGPSHIHKFLIFGGYISSTQRLSNVTYLLTCTLMNPESVSAVDPFASADPHFAVEWSRINYSNQRFRTGTLDENSVDPRMNHSACSLRQYGSPVGEVADLMLVFGGYGGQQFPAYP